MVVAILDAARNSMSFFMLLVVSLGLSVVNDSLGKTMLRCQILAGAHFIFGSKLIILSCESFFDKSISIVRYRYRRITTRVDVRARAFAICDPACIHTKRIPFVDNVLIEWFFFLYLS